MDFGVCKKHIPNSITCCNLVSGCIAITFAIKGDLPFGIVVYYFRRGF